MAQTTQKVYAPIELGLDRTLDERRQGEAHTLARRPEAPAGKLAYIETYGCQMNFSDTEIIASVLVEEGYHFTRNEEEADLIFINTCSIRENAEAKVWNRLRQWQGLKRQNPGLIVGVLGCMAERLKHKLLEESQLVDLVVGPDAYRELPTLLAEAGGGQRAVNVLLSREETYADFAPIRLNTNGVSAFISIMRGCNNMCSFCVVPFTRGRERSRSPESIVREAEDLFQNGYREVTLLGQNVDSYNVEGTNFAKLLARVARVDDRLRVRFSTSHPKDMTDEVLETIAAHPNICNFIHLPVQSGSSTVLERMRRGHTREWYLERIEAIRRIIPGCGLSTDLIAGFCGETEADHRLTLELMEAVRFDHAFMFHYSERPGTPAAKRFTDDVPLDMKKRRLQEIIALQQRHSRESNQRDIGREFRVLIEGDSKKSAADYAGRNGHNKMIVFPKRRHSFSAGDYVSVRVTDATSATLLGTIAP